MPEVDRVPWSVMISFGSSCNLNISLIKAVAKCYMFISFLYYIKWLILFWPLMTSRIASYSSDFGRSLLKSMDIHFHGYSGILFVLVHIVEVGQLSFSGRYSHIFSLNSSCVTNNIFLVWRSSIVLAVPRCPAIGLLWCQLIRLICNPLSSGIHFFAWYHSMLSFHWHNPRVNPFVSLILCSLLFRSRVIGHPPLSLLQNLFFLGYWVL